MTLKKLKNGRYQVRWREENGSQRARNFRSKEIAQEFLRALNRGEVGDQGPSVTKRRLRDIIDEWRSVRYSGMSAGTRVRYDNLIRLYFDPLMDLGIREITPAAVDKWIAWMKEDPNRFGKEGIRTSFKHELTLLRAILGYYHDYHDDPRFTVPIKRRHGQAVKLRARTNHRPNDLSEEDFLRWRDRLEEVYGTHVAAMATLQFYNALRISEAVALRWEDLRLNWESPKLSRVVFTQHAIYARSKAVPDFIEPGFKNSEGVKEHPVLPEVFRMFAKLHKPGIRGLIFTAADREFYGYRQVQYRYNRTFQKLGLPYSSTHVMRHGGTRKTFDETGGDFGIAAQQLGNLSRQTVDVYAKRASSAFTRYAKDLWDQKEEARARNVHSSRS